MVTSESSTTTAQSGSRSMKTEPIVSWLIKDNIVCKARGLTLMERVGGGGGVVRGGNCLIMNWKSLKTNRRHSIKLFTSCKRHHNTRLRRIR